MSGLGLTPDQLDQLAERGWVAFAGDDDDGGGTPTTSDPPTVPGAVAQITRAANRIGGG